MLSLPKEKTPEEKIRSRVGRYFGITDDFKVAGYITPDGKLLDFSGRRQGNSFSVSRNIDHRQVGYAFENSEFEDKYSGTEGMKDFMDLGYVRISWLTVSILETITSTKVNNSKIIEIHMQKILH